MDGLRNHLDSFLGSLTVLVEQALKTSAYYGKRSWRGSWSVQHRIGHEGIIDLVQAESYSIIDVIVAVVLRRRDVD